MSLSDANKLDIVFKYFVGRSKTSNNKSWYEELAGKLLYLHINEIWSDEIPENPPTSSTDVISIVNYEELTLDNTVSDNKSWKYCLTPGDLTTHVGMFIPPRFGQGYTIRIFDANNNEIPNTHPSKWIFNYENGILIFEENPVNYGITLPIKIFGYRYTGNIGISQEPIYCCIDIDGGNSVSVYLLDQNIDGGGASATSFSENIDGGDSLGCNT